MKELSEELYRLQKIETELKSLIRFCEMNNDVPTMYALYKILRGQ